MYRNLDAALLWLRLLAKYLIKDCDMKISQSDLCILFNKYHQAKLELIMSVHVYDIFMTGRKDNFKKLKDLIKLKFNIQQYGKVKKFLEVYYEWGHDKKVRMPKIPWRKT